jgi:hypothetical protein
MLIDPIAGAIAIDTGGREIAEPATLREMRERCAVHRQHGISLLVRRDRLQQMGGTVERRRRQRTVALEEMRRDAAIPERCQRLRRAAGAGNAPAFGKQRVGEGERAVAEAKAE